MSTWPTPGQPRGSTRVGLATHDPRFFAAIRAPLQHRGHVVLDDPWQGHGRHHEPLSRSIAGWADIVFAEWCLGNAVWHARHRRRGARLIVRFHRFELDTDFPPNLEIGAVDAVVFVGPHIREEAIRRFGWPEERCVVIPNAVDTAAFDRPKSLDARFTLGLLTWHRRLKRLDLALDLLEALRSDEPRYRLRVKGRRPEDVDHVWKYPDERAYFEQQYDRIRRSPLLGDHVIFDPPGDDVPEWFTGVGHVLSVSDVESFHLALAEGMASRAVPVIRDRPGAGELFPRRWITSEVASMVAQIVDLTDPSPWAEAGQDARGHVVQRYDRSVITPAWMRLIAGPPGRH